MLSWTERYLHAGADRVAFKGKGMGEHRVGGIFNVGTRCFSFSFNSFRRRNFHNNGAKGLEMSEFNSVSDTQSVHGLRQVTYLSSI